MTKSQSNAVKTINRELVLNFANQYRVCVQKTASAILDLANVVYQAKKELNRDEYLAFRESIGADKSKESYLKKLNVIAEHSARFLNIRDQLPPNYTTLYALTQVSETVFDRMINDQAITSEMKASVIDKYKTVIKSRNVRVVYLSFKNVAVAQQAIALDEIRKVCKKYKIDMKDSQSANATTVINSLDDLNAVAVVSANDETLVAA